MQASVTTIIAVHSYNMSETLDVEMWIIVVVNTICLHDNNNNLPEQSNCIARSVAPTCMSVRTAFLLDSS